MTRKFEAVSLKGDEMVNVTGTSRQSHREIGSATQTTQDDDKVGEDETSNYYRHKGGRQCFPG